MSATCRTGPGGTHLLGLRSRGGRGRLRARVLPSPSRARDVWPGAAPASPVPPPSRRGWERPEAAPGGRGPLSARPLRPAPHCPGGGTLRGPGAGSPPGRAVAPPLARAAPSSFAGGPPSPTSPSSKTQSTRGLGGRTRPPGAAQVQEVAPQHGLPACHAWACCLPPTSWASRQHLCSFPSFLICFSMTLPEALL